MKTSKEAHIVKCDDDGHDYLIPESLDRKFEIMLVEAGTLKDPVHTLFIDEFEKYQIGNVFYDLKIYKWEIKE